MSGIRLPDIRHRVNLPPRAKPILHLYRALLREATYLPDPAARAYVHERIIARFRQRKHVKDAEEAAKGGKTARSWLSRLQRANNGDHTLLERLLMHTYGRAGFRRRQLVERIMGTPSIVEKPALSAGQSPAADTMVELFTLRQFAARISMRKNRNGDYVFQISDRYPLLGALFEAQVNNRHYWTAQARASLKSTILTVPAKNSWEKSMPRNRLRNKVERWHKAVMKTLLPPLPAEEFGTLASRAMGSIPFEGIRPRRPGIAPSPQDVIPTDLSAVLDSQTQHLGCYATSPSKRPAPRNASSPSRYFDGLVSQSLIKESLLDDATGVQRLNKHFGKTKMNSKINTFTSRSMRRVWHKVLQLCCTASWDVQESKWVIEMARVQRVFANASELQSLVPQTDLRICPELGTAVNDSILVTEHKAEDNSRPN